MPSNKWGTLGEARFRFESSLRDPAKAMELAEQYAAEVVVEKVDLNVKDAKLQKIRGKKDLDLLPGVSNQDISDRIRAIVGLRFQLFPDREIERRLDIYQGCIHELERRYYAAFDAAQAEQAKVVLSDYYRNMLVNRAALSRAGSVAVEALTSVASDKAAGARNRVDAARAILSLVDMKSPGGDDVGTGVANAMRDTVQMILEKEANGGDSYIVDADFEEGEDAS